MGKHVHEEVHLEVDADQVTTGPEASDDEKLKALVEALSDEDIDIEVTTNSTVIDE